MLTENSKQRLAVFDFCETLADFQTATAFVDFVRNNSKTPSVRLRHAIYVVLVKSQIVRLLNAITAHRYSIGKHIKLWQLRGLPQATVETLARRFYVECIEPHLIGPVVERLRQMQQEGCSVGLSSGGYDVYLKYFVEAYGLDFCQCSVIQFKNGRCLGRMAGRDCMRNEKVRRLQSAFGSSDISSVAFSDSESDLPLLQWATEAVVVSRGRHQKWIEKYHFNEIIW